jgi:hypothetical protein
LLYLPLGLELLSIPGRIGNLLDGKNRNRKALPFSTRQFIAKIPAAAARSDTVAG